MIWKVFNSTDRPASISRALSRLEETLERRSAQRRFSPFSFELETLRLVGREDPITTLRVRFGERLPVGNQEDREKAIAQISNRAKLVTREFVLGDDSSDFARVINQVTDDLDLLLASLKAEDLWTQADLPLLQQGSRQ